MKEETNRNTIETDLIKLEKQHNREQKPSATILKILLWIEPDSSKGVANSLHEVVFDFENNINTWVNHREMGKLNPESWYSTTNTNEKSAMDMLFDRGFIPHRNNRGDDELIQTANYLASELVISCKTDMNSISNRLNKWRTDNNANERQIISAFMEGKSKDKDEKSNFQALKMSV